MWMLALLSSARGFPIQNLCLFARGWRGINIDANPEAIALFRKTRPRDISVCIGVGEKAEVATYYSFSEPAFNTFDPEAASVVTNTRRQIIDERSVEVKPPS